MIIGIFNISHCCSKKFGPGWNAVVGEAYSFEISYTKWVLFLSGFKLLFKTSCPSSSLIWFKEIHIAGERWCTCTLAATWVYVSGKQIDIWLSYHISKCGVKRNQINSQSLVTSTPPCAPPHQWRWRCYSPIKPISLSPHNPKPLHAVRSHFKCTIDHNATFRMIGCKNCMKDDKPEILKSTIGRWWGRRRVFESW